MKSVGLAILLAVSLLAPSFAASKLDLGLLPDPSPTMALTYSIAFPGGGWFYLAEGKTAGQDTLMGVLFLAATVAGVVLGVQTNSRGENPAPWFGGAYLAYMGGAISAAQEAEDRRDLKIVMRFGPAGGTK